MKKILLVLISVLLVLSFIGCTDEDEASYTVSYNSNETMCDCPELVASYQVGETVTVLDGEYPSKSKSPYPYFDHWTMTTNDVGTTYTNGNTFVMPANHVILYGQPGYTK